MTQLLRDFVERVQGLVATHRAAGRRGGPLLDFISADFLYILTTVAVVGVAGGAYATYERGSYSRDLRAIVTGIVSYGTHGKLRNMTLEDLDMVIPTGIEVDVATGVTYFGGILGDGLPLRIYGGTSACENAGNLITLISIPVVWEMISIPVGFLASARVIVVQSQRINHLRGLGILVRVPAAAPSDRAPFASDSG